ncbi:MAG: hypothetical protein ACPGVB_05725 [Chitinophagales bacterium]
MVKRPFEQWLFEEVEIEFGLDRVKKMPQLEEWLDTKNLQQEREIPPYISRLRKLLLENVDTWNEDELKMHFIAPFLLEIDFYNQPHYRVFTQRFMRLQTKTVEAAGRVEWMVATGKQTPRNPFFFLQEYKPEKGPHNDPLGQLLIAMVDAQILNDAPKKPIYGCYNLGRFWFFVLLQEKIYSVSRAYDATRKNDMRDMIVIFKRVKNHIHRELGLPIEVKCSKSQEQ